MSTAEEQQEATSPVSDPGDAGLLARLRRIVHDPDGPGGKAFALVIQVLIVLSIVSFSIETLPDLDPRLAYALYVIEVVTVLLFTAEYLLRLAVAENRLAFVFSFFGLIDLLAILPFYVAPAVDLRAIRVLRLLRLFRILKFARYNRAVRRLHAAFLEVRAELTIYLAATLCLIFLASVGIYYFEGETQPEHFGSVFHAMWWSVVTLTTVGYGDVYPVTLGGRIFTGLLLLIGIGVISVPSGLIAAALTKVKEVEG